MCGFRKRIYEGAVSRKGIYELAANVKGGKTMNDYCVCCGRSLKNGTLTLPWEDGDNKYAYVTCPYCGEENIQEGYGEDDD